MQDRLSRLERDMQELKKTVAQRVSGSDAYFQYGIDNDRRLRAAPILERVRGSRLSWTHPCETGVAQNYGPVWGLYYSIFPIV